MTQQTAVEWFWIHLEDSISKEYFDLFQQAKAMEKEQMIDFMDDYINNCCYVTKIGDIGCNKTTEQYYNETYNK